MGLFHAFLARNLLVYLIKDIMATWVKTL